MGKEGEPPPEKDEGGPPGGAEGGPPWVTGCKLDGALEAEGPAKRFAVAPGGPPDLVGRLGFANRGESMAAADTH